MPQSVTRLFFVLMEYVILFPRSLEHLQNHKWFLYKGGGGKVFFLILRWEEVQTNAAQLQKWIECQGRTCLSRVQTAQDGDRTLLCNSYKMFPLHGSGKGQGCSCQACCPSFPVLENVPLKIHIHKSFSKGSLFSIVFIYLRPFQRNLALFWNLVRVSTPGNHTAQTMSKEVF